MSDQGKENTIKCKGCNFVMKSDKLLIHLNHPKVKCKEAFSKKEYDLVYDLWMESKLSIKPLLQQRIKCRGCNYEIDKYDLVFHLNDKKVDCKKAYSKDEYGLIFDFWMTHQKKDYKKSLRELPCSVLLKCYGCEETHISGMLSSHVRSSENCQGAYSNDERTSLNMLETDYHWLKKKEKDDERAELVAKHYFKNLIDENIRNVHEDAKPFFVDYGVIQFFVHHYWGLQSDQYKSDSETPVAVLLGYEDNFGYHGKELLYLPKQGKNKYRKSINLKALEAIVNSKTSKEFEEDGVVMMWISSFSSNDLCFSGYDAHILFNWKKMCSNLVISMMAKVKAKDYLQIGDYAFYDLNDLGKTSIKNCNIITKDQPQICPHEMNAPFYNRYFKHKKVVITYSTVITITDMDEYYDGTTYTYETKPLLFDPKYFAKPQPDKPKPDVELKNSASADRDYDEGQTKQNIQNKIPQNDEALLTKVCKSCKEEMAINTIMKHLGAKSECKEKYSNEDLEDLRNQIKSFQNAKRRKRRSDKNSKETSTHQDFVQCMVCQTNFPINTIMKHLVANVKCNDGHSDEDLKSIEMKCEKYQKAKRNCEDRERYHKRKKDSQQLTENKVTFLTRTIML